MINTLKELRKDAKAAGLTIEACRHDNGWGYWLRGTRWTDGTYAGDLDELADMLTTYLGELA